MTKTETTAYRLGRMAFLGGRPRVAALDTDLMGLLPSETYDERVRIMTDWYWGWDTANLLTW
jgi:hypothetical protein